MKAVVFHDVGDIRLEDAPDPVMEDQTDAIVRITASAICGTDLHFVRGSVPGMKPGTILGHEAVGVVEGLGAGVRNLNIGDRVVVPSTIACGYCVYCRAGYFAQCDNANPNGRSAGTAFFGGPEGNGGFHGLQAELARIPFAHVGLVKLPDEISDEEAILISDIFPTGYFGAKLAEIKPGDIVAVFGCGPVGQFAIASAKLMEAGRILAVDGVENRLEMAQKQGAEIINFEKEDPVTTILDLTGGIGVDRAIDAVGVDAVHAHRGPAAREPRQSKEEFQKEIAEVTEGQGVSEEWDPGDAPSQALRWAVDVVAKAGTLAIVGVYPPTHSSFPIGAAMNKNLTMKMGNCNHRQYIPKLIELVRNGTVTPSKILTRQEPLTSAVEAYKVFSQKEPGWMKVKLAA